MTVADDPMTAGTARASYVDWAAIFAGAVVAAALSFVLMTFGSGLGLSLVSPEAGEGVSLRWLAIAAGVWFVWVVISSFAAGGYLAGRLRRGVGDATADEVETRDGAHGIIVWATGALLGAMITAAGFGGIVGATVTAGGTVADAIEEQGEYLGSLFLRTEAGAAFENPEARAEIGMIVLRSVTRGEVTPADRDHLVRIVAAETGADAAEAEARVDAALNEVESARQAAVEAIEQARIGGVIAAFVVAATLLIGALAAYFAAIAGGHHRDSNIPFRSFAGRHPSRRAGPAAVADRV